MRYVGFFIFSLILSYLLIIVSCIIFLIINGGTEDGREKIWFCSKALTIRDLIKKNNFETYPILNFDLNGNRNLYKSNYQNLLAYSGKQCKKDYKKCGIIDTMGNIMCIPKEDICPINEVKIDLESNNISYIKQGYNFTYLKNLAQGYILYYKNNETNNSIITDIKYSQEIPKYINTDNFVLDKEKYDEYEDSLKPHFDYDFSIKNISFLFRRKKDKKRKVLRKLELNVDDKHVYNFLIEKMKGDWNIDKSYQNIDMNIYKGNYIGFQDTSNMQKYNNIDLYEIDSILFPNSTAVIFCYISIPFIFALFVEMYIIMKQKNVNLLTFLRLGLPELPISIGYFIYILYENSNIYLALDEIMNIKADPFLQEHLMEIQKRKPSHNNIVALTVLFSCTLGLTLLSFCFLLCHVNSDEIEGKSNNEQKENLLEYLKSFNSQ